MESDEITKGVNVDKDEKMVWDKTLGMPRFRSHSEEEDHAFISFTIKPVLEEWD